MANDRSNENDWFAPKRFGLGAGLPIAWQGWAVLGAFFAVLAGATALLMPQHPTLFVAIALIDAAALTLAAAHHTRGGFRWRWGGDE